MQATDKRKFLEVLAGVHDFYGKDLSTFAGSVWWQACSGFDIEQVTKALSAHLMDADRGQWMPKPADIVRQLHGTHADRSLMAWSKVHEAMRTVGGYTSVDFCDSATHQAIIDMGGWPALCRSSIDELPFLQKRFCEAHRVYSQRGADDAPKALPGEHEAQNRLSGRMVAPPVVIGRRHEDKRLSA